MNILQNLLENEILNEETKNELEQAIQSQISEAVETAVENAKRETEINVRAELAEQFVTDKEALVEALDTKAQQLLESELAEFKDDVDNFRDLEVEYAEKVVNIKKQLSEVAKKDFAQLVNILNEFLEERVTAEIDELKEDINEVKKIRFGQAIYEAMKDTFEREHFDKDEIDRRAAMAQAELKKIRTQLKETEEKLAKTVRKQVMTETLSSLEGKPREVMAAILENTPTEKLGEVYEEFIGRVLNESVVEDDEEKESKVLAEDSKPNKEKVVTKTVSVTGDVKAPLVETVDDAVSRLSDADREKLRELIGRND